MDFILFMKTVIRVSH